MARSSSQAAVLLCRSRQLLWLHSKGSAERHELIRKRSSFVTTVVYRLFIYLLISDQCKELVMRLLLADTEQQRLSSASHRDPASGIRS